MESTNIDINLCVETSRNREIGKYIDITTARTTSLTFILLYTIHDARVPNIPE